MLFANVPGEKLCISHVSRYETQTAIMRARQDIAKDDPNARISRKRGNQLFQPVLIDFAVIAGDSDHLVLRYSDSDIQRRREPSCSRSNPRNASVTQQRFKR